MTPPAVTTAAAASPPRSFLTGLVTHRLAPWLAWLLVFYTAWSLMVFTGGRWEVVREHWQIAVAMALGSYVAGSTPMGGGTIGFPILVLLLDQPASLGRYFSFAVQSIGMVSASIFVICLRRRVAWRVLRWAMLGALVGTPLGALLVVPHASDLFTAVLFAVLWASFGVMTLFKIRELAGLGDITPTGPAFDRAVGLTTGLVGSVFISSLTGVGIDMLLYALLVLLLRADLKIAIPTSIIIMAFTSLVGVATNTLLGHMTHEVFTNWLAAAPIVILGAPLGAFIVTIIPRPPTLIFVSILCIGQFIWTCHAKQLSWPVIAMACGGVVAFQAVFHLLYKRGIAMARRAGTLST